MTKLQFGTTHELASVPNLPLIGNLYEKAKSDIIKNLPGVNTAYEAPKQPALVLDMENIFWLKKASNKCSI